MNAATHDHAARQRWLCVAYSFPPINRSGTHRTLAFVRQLAAAGWDASVLTVDPIDEPIDDTLNALVPRTVDVTRVICPNLVDALKRFTGLGHSRPTIDSHTESVQSTPTDSERPRCNPREWFTRLLQIPDSQLGWYRPAIRAGRRILKSQSFDVVYSTSPCMTAHLIARQLSRSFGVPWVADFRDPWVDNPFRAMPFKSLAWWDRVLERRVMRDATHVICNTATMRDRLCERHPFVGAKSSVIMNGYDTDRMPDFGNWSSFRGGCHRQLAVRVGTDGQADRESQTMRVPHIRPVHRVSTPEFVLTHAGQFYGRRNPEPLLRALRRVVHTQDVADRPVRLILVGPDKYDGIPLAQLARKHDVQSHVTVTGAMPHPDALTWLAGSDAVILMGSPGPGSDLQVPNKLFEYLALQRPILAAVSAVHPSVGILQRAHADYKTAAPDDPKALAQAIERLADPNRRNAEFAWSGVGLFDRAHRAAELLAVFQNVTGFRASDESVTMAHEICDRALSMGNISPAAPCISPGTAPATQEVSV